VVFTAVLAALVTAAALVAVAKLRSPASDGSSALDLGASGSALSSGSPDCGGGACHVLASQTVNGMPIKLLADAQGAHGRFQAGDAVIEMPIAALGARLDAGSLTCVASSVSACLVSAGQNGGKIGQLLVERSGTWHSVDKPYFSDAGVIVLGNVSGGDAPEVVVVQSSPALAQVYALDGKTVGCTKKYSSPSQLRGWPNVRVTASDLRSCP
jgi:hypothetical protein